MNDLISRQAVYDIIQEELNLRCGYDADIALWSVKKRVSDMPTAYDVEKVATELTNIKKDTANKCPQVSIAICNKYTDCGVCLMDRTIDIVRRGGVNE